MSTTKPLKIVLGTASIGDKVTGPEVPAFLGEFQRHGHVEIDTAAAYPPGKPGVTERVLGEQSGLSNWAQISTKLMGFGEAPNSTEKVREGIEASRERLNGADFDLYYFHLPDKDTPMEEQAAAMDEAYKGGKFKRFGISNFSPVQVKELLEVADRKGYVKPSVLQAQYNLFSRRGDEDLLPLLRKHGMSLYAYSPAAAGMLSGKVDRDIANDSESRWSKESFGGQLYVAHYHNDPIFDASRAIREVAAKHDIKGHAAGIRWVVYHSPLSNEHGDAAILGASSVEQLRENLEAVDAGPLPDEVVKTIEDVWPTVKEVAPWSWL